MLEKLFAHFKDEDAPPAGEGQNPLAEAVACLLVEAARVDEDYTEKEQTLITQMISKRFDLSNTEADALRLEAETVQEQAVDLYHFSSAVKDGLDHEGKMQLIEDMWRIALSDGRCDPYEEMVIRRLIGLLHMSDRDSTQARRRAERA